MGKSSYSDASQIVQTVIKGFEAARAIGKSYLLIDRYYLSVPALETMNSLNTAANEKLVDIMTKGKSNVVVYEKPQPTEKPKRGRPRKKGDKVYLSPLFDEVDKFEETEVPFTEKSRMCLPLQGSFVGTEVISGTQVRSCYPRRWEAQHSGKY